MRANSSLPSLVVVVLALVGGCSPADEPSAVVGNPEPVPPRAPEPHPPPAELLRRVEQLGTSESQVEQNEIREGRASDEVANVPPPLPRPRTLLVFQCTDEVTFAVRSASRGLEVYPPRYSNGYILLAQQPSDAGLYYTAPGAELRMNDDLATLQVGRDSYVDCVSNPAAAVWQEPSPRGTPAR